MSRKFTALWKGLANVRRQSLTLVVAAAACTTMTPAASSQDDSAVSSDKVAEELMIRAHDARANWDDMPGFTAELTVTENGEVHPGEISITQDGEIALDFEDEFDHEWVQTRLESLFLHRQSRVGGFDVSFADDQEHHPLGRLIRVNDDQAMGSKYRANGDLITEVHRNMGDTRFTITVLDVYRNSENKYLPRSYFLAFWDSETGDLTSTMNAHDDWVRVDQWDLPACLLSIDSDDDGQRRVREIRMEQHHLNGAAEQTASH